MAKIFIIAASFAISNVLPTTNVFSQTVDAEREAVHVSNQVTQASVAAPTKPIDKQTLSELWASLIQKDADIKFVVQKVLPPNPTAEQRKIVMDLVLREINPEYATNDAAPKTTGMVPRLLPEQEARERFLATIRMQIPDAPKLKFAEAQAVMLYRLVRNSVQKLMDAYDNLDHSRSNLQNAQDDLAELEMMMKEKAETSNDLQSQFTIRKAQRDVETARQNYDQSLSSLVELVGGSAAEKLDKSPSH